MSEIRNERHDDASVTPTAATPAGGSAPTYGATPQMPTASPASSSPAPVFPAPIVSPGTAYGAPTPRAYGAPVGYGLPPAQTTPQASAQPSVPFGGHTTHPHFGAAFGAASASATTAPGSAFGPGALATPTAPAKRSRGGMFAGALALVAIVGLGAGVGGAYLGDRVFTSAVSTGDSSGPQTVTINNPDSVNAVAAVSAKVMPSTVTLTVSAGQSGGSGSGVILSEDGYVLTNTHVVTLGGGASDATVRVTTTDGRIYDAKIVGTDPTYDLAVVKLEGASGLTPIEWGDSTKLNVGDQTIAIGSPLGLDDTVTSGIVSALNRSISIQSAAVPESQSDQSPQDQQNGSESPFQFDLPGQSQQSGAAGTISIAVVQTDAAINPGNSGGALVNGDGKLIGINVAIATAGSGSGESGSIGVGFAIPASVAERVANEIIETGSASHGLLGATVGSATAATSGTTVEGAVIGTLSPGGAALKAGLAEGDVVTKFNGAPISNATDLTAQVRALAAGSEAKLSYNRDGKSYDVTVTLGALTP